MVAGASSALYECEVMHHRLTPRGHRFNYRVFYLWLDLDELAGWTQRSLLLGHNRSGLFSFFDSDHLGGTAGATKDRLIQWLDTEGMQTGPITSVKMLTFPRVLGYIFNPVCFFFCFAADGKPVCAVAQVTNTFHEQKLYLVKDREPDGRFRLITPKHFYVSPFSDLDLCFDFKIRVPGEKLDIHIDDREGDRRVLLSALTGKRTPLSDGRLLWFAMKYPLLTLRVIFLIHWQAFRLWLKRLPVYRKGARPEMQRNVLKPHASLSAPDQNHE